MQLEQALRRQILARLLLGVLSLMVVGLGLFEEESLNYKMIVAGGNYALLSLYALTFIAIMTLLDTFINDIAPDSWRLPWACKNRHLFWSLMAVNYAGYTYVLVNQGVGYWLGGVFLIYAFGCLGVAFFDLRYRALDRIRLSER